MGMLERWTLLLAVLFIQACSSEQPPNPPPGPAPAKTVFDPLTQQMDKARGVQSTVDQGAANTQKAIDAQERGDSSP
jgi:hypothetical protein